MSAAANENCLWGAQTLAKSLGSVLDAMTGESWIWEAEPAEPECAAELIPANWWCQRAAAGADGSFWLGGGETASREIGSRVLRSAGIEELDEASVSGTYKEILSQAVGSFLQSVGTRLRRELTMAAGPEGAPVGESLSWFLLKGRTGAGDLSLVLVLETTLLQNMEQVAAQAQAAVDTPGSAQQALTTGVQTAQTADTAAARPMDLLLDVELPVSISFGKAQLTLKEVIKLTSGSIVELNRTISEPVEVIVNNCVIAKGEVVVVEGNFGVRIQQVISRQERLRTLR